MGKLTPPTVVRDYANAAKFSLNQVIEAQRALVNAVKGITGNTATMPEKRPRVCSQCGAPLHGHTCEYCRTEYNDDHENRKNDN